MLRDAKTSATIEDLNELDGTQLERVVRDIWKLEGYETEWTGLGPDGSVDVRAVNGDKILGIQVKNPEPGNSVGVPAVRQYHSIKTDRRDFNEVAVVTSTDFTAPAKAFAYDHDMDLIDGRELAETIVEHGYATSGESPLADLETESKDGERMQETATTNLKTDHRGFIRAVWFSAAAAVLGPVLVFGTDFVSIGEILLGAGLIGLTFTVSADVLSLRLSDAAYQPTLLWPIATFISIGFLGVCYAFVRISRTHNHAY